MSPSMPEDTPRASSSRRCRTRDSRCASPMRKRGFQMQAAVETLARPDEDIGRRAGAPQDFVRQTARPPRRRGIVWHDDQHVVIAVGPRVSTCLRAEEIDTLRTIRLDEPADDFRQHRVTLQNLDCDQVHFRFVPRLPSGATLFNITARVERKNQQGVFFRISRRRTPKPVKGRLLRC